jgi:hypothetical protein
MGDLDAIPGRAVVATDKSGEVGLRHDTAGPCSFIEWRQEWV